MVRSFQFDRCVLFRSLLRRQRLTSAGPDTTPPTVPVHKPQFLPTRQTPQLRATWLGHACYLVEFPGGLRVLFDPVFTKRCSPFSWLGPSRYTEIPCEIADIPFIDAVIISHNHYDHLSHPTILKIRELNPNAPFFVPLGNRNWFTECGIHNVTELDWWEECDMRLLAVESESDTGKQENIMARIGCLPCQHMSARTPTDRNATLWASWSVESGGKKIWFGGYTDTRSSHHTIGG
jgi:L-ascorbate metabolism protein UlaG (beta-lactamase superfamily)